MQNWLLRNDVKFLLKLWRLGRLIQVLLFNLLKMLLTFSVKLLSLLRNRSFKVLVKQTELHSVQKEFNKLKEERKNVCVPSSSDVQIQDMEQYEAVCKELDTAKQELRKIRQVSNEISETKTVALGKVEDAKEVTKVHCEKIELLRNEIAAVNESVEQTKLACSESRKEQSEIFAEKEIQQHLYKAGMEESAKKLVALKNEFDPEFAEKLDVQLTETYNKIDELQKQMENVKASDMDSVNGVSLELNEANGFLEKLLGEERSLQELVESLKAELKNVKSEHREVEAREAEIESVAGDLHLKLSRSKSELEETVIFFGICVVNRQSDIFSIHF